MTENVTSAARQTVSYLTRRFREVGFRPATKHGQNFLIDLNLIDLLAETAQVDGRDVVLEVGTGMGSLTGRLAQKAAAVITVEIDAHLHQLAREELVDAENVTFLRFDALKNKNHFDPRLLEVVGRQLAAAPERRLKLAANLPYNIATPVLSNLLRLEPPPVLMTATIQKEVAERLVAAPGVKAYSSLSIWVQSLCDVEVIRILPPGVFWPRPKVESAIVRITPRPEKRAAIPDLDFFHSFVRGLFAHRRKFLRSNLQSAFKDRLDKKQIDEALAARELTGERRAEELRWREVLLLSEEVRKRL
jgi:16S rRNA (adenine1518-N6/adenine1519-N6)-dimethyltransferase